ncbi:response regulator [Desulfococcaceae bacterium HSG9]|nr:response regulator [Desulfococcaceae bacterium HSG9]
MPDYFRLNITKKLFLLNLLIFIVFGVIIGTMGFGFSSIEKLSATIIERDVYQPITNSQFVREFSEVLAKTNLLVITFHKNDNILEIEGNKLLNAITGLLRNTNNTQRSILEEFDKKLRLILEQCAAINKISQRIDIIYRKLNSNMTSLEETISEDIILKITEGGDASILRQTGSLIPTFRENLVNATLHYAMLKPDKSKSIDVLQIAILLDNLHLRLQTLLTSDSVIAAYGSKLLAGVLEYRKAVIALADASKQLKERLVELNNAEKQTAIYLNEIDTQIADASDLVKEKIKSVINSTIHFVYLFSGGVIILFGLFTYFLIQKNIRNPMKSIHRGIVSISEGDLDTKIQLERTDEWSKIEQALNKMVVDLKESYQDLEKEILQRKNTEKELQKSEERYRKFFEDDLSAAFISTPEGKLTACNPAYVRMFGFSSVDEAMNTNMSIIFKSEKTRKSFLSLLRANRHIEHYESEYKRFDGTAIYAVGNITGTFNLQGELIELKGYLIDESKRKLAEHDKTKLLAELQRAQKMEAIGTLAGGVAHDLNNILSGLVSYPELLLMNLEEDNSLRKPLLTIKKSGEKAANVVQDLLTLARRGVAVTEVINLNHTVSEYLKSLEYKKLQSFHPNIQEKTDFEADLLNIMGSPVHLTKTVMNLISNAFEAIPDGGNVTVSTRNRYIDKPVRGYDEVKEGDYVIFNVTDDGIGISPEDMERIFEPFYTKKVMGRSGTGLGMAVVWGTVKDHNGYIGTQSKEGQGTSFTLFFPVTRKKRAESESLLPVEEYTGKGESVLVVDDVEEQREIATEMLRKLSYSVTTVSSGEEAVEYMKNNSADLIVLDMIMDPGMNGRETYEKIIELHPHQKAVIASGFAESDDVKAALELGAGQYIKKPYTLQKIGIAVRDEL